MQQRFNTEVKKNDSQVMHLNLRLHFSIISMILVYSLAIIELLSYRNIRNNKCTIVQVGFTGYVV